MWSTSNITDMLSLVYSTLSKVIPLFLGPAIH